MNAEAVIHCARCKHGHYPSERSKEEIIRILNGSGCENCDEPSHEKVGAIIAKFPGLEEWQTGGGCTAYGMSLDDGMYFMLTDSGGGEIPNDSSEGIMCGLYDSDGECAGPGEHYEIVALDELEGWISDTIEKHHRSLAQLSEELRSYCSANGLPQWSADELLAVSAKLDETGFLKDFIKRWDRRCDRDRAERARQEQEKNLQKIEEQDSENGNLEARITDLEWMLDEVACSGFCPEDARQKIKALLNSRKGVSL